MMLPGLGSWCGVSHLVALDLWGRGARGLPVMNLMIEFVKIGYLCKRRCKEIVTKVLVTAVR
jgi:hypothetical protein